jgi:hypothetical protein
MERTQHITRFEVILGALVIAVLALAVVPMLREDAAMGGVQKAAASAEIIAKAVLDYRAETGDWPPRDAGGGLDPTCLTGPPSAAATATAMNGTMAGGDPNPWLARIPLDPWYRPYRVHLLGEGSARRLVVLSAGPDGSYQTSPAVLAALRPSEAPAFAGDDTGAVLDAGGMP